MGFFSWKTQDTNRSICIAYGKRSTFPVTMTDNKGNKWLEKDYEGYGVFGGKDYYELLAEMNGLTTREEGINLQFSGKPFLAPNLTEDSDHIWIDEEPKNCEYQGFCYPDDDEDEEL